ncbi:MAG: hypothetical protein ACRDJC_19820 [Thermomicrobiales bacterium]
MLTEDIAHAVHGLVPFGRYADEDVAVRQLSSRLFQLFEVITHAQQEAAQHPAQTRPLERCLDPFDIVRRHDVDLIRGKPRRHQSGGHRLHRRGRDGADDLPFRRAMMPGRRRRRRFIHPSLLSPTRDRLPLSRQPKPPQA